MRKAAFPCVLVVAAALVSSAHAAPIASLNRSAAIFSAPNLHAWTRTVLPLHTPLSQQRTAVPVLKERPGWLRVLLPGRPNGHAAWIRANTARIWSTPWRIIIRTASRRLLVLRNNRIVRSFPVVVGKPSTPTPRGRFFVEEALRLPLGSAGSPIAYALSARSTVFQEFDDRDPRHLRHRRHAGNGRVARLHPHDGGRARLDDPAPRHRHPGRHHLTTMLPSRHARRRRGKHDVADQRERTRDEHVTP